MKTFTLLICLFCIALQTAIAEPFEKQIKLDGGISFVTVPAGTNKAIFFGVSRGNSTSRIEVQVTGPESLTLKAQGALFKKGFKQSTPLLKPRWYKVSLLTSKVFSATHNGCVEISPGESEIPKDDIINIADFPPIEDPLCDLFEEQELQLLATQLSETFGGNWTTGNVCAYIVFLYNQAGGGTLEFPTPTPTPATVTTELLTTSKTYRRYALFRKDACKKNKKARYLFRLTLDLSAIDPLQYSNGVSLSVRVNEFKYLGNKASSLKPKSEGRFSPRPIVLMNWLGSNCGSNITVTKWRKGKPKKASKLNIYSYLPYRGLVLALATADSVLKGGKGTFEIANERDAYGVCFKLKRKRQRVHGYPN